MSSTRRLLPTQGQMAGILEKAHRVISYNVLIGLSVALLAPHAAIHLAGIKSSATGLVLDVMGYCQCALLICGTLLVIHDHSSRVLRARSQNEIFQQRRIDQLRDDLFVERLFRRWWIEKPENLAPLVDEDKQRRLFDD